MTLPGRVQQLDETVRRIDALLAEIEPLFAAEDAAMQDVIEQSTDLDSVDRYSQVRARIEVVADELCQLGPLVHTFAAPSASLSAVVEDAAEMVSRQVTRGLVFASVLRGTASYHTALDVWGTVRPTKG